MLIDGEAKWEVEQILDLCWHRHGGQLQYLVKWVGYLDSVNS
jgi:hypothetical protein